MTTLRTCSMTALLGAVLISACSPTTDPLAPDDASAAILRTAPSISGQITAVALPMVMVEENPAESHGSDKARVRITEATQVLRESEGVVGATELGVGQQVKVWFTGPVMESYPSQATAGVIVIDSNR